MIDFFAELFVFLFVLFVLDKKIAKNKLLWKDVFRVLLIAGVS